MAADRRVDPAPQFGMLGEQPRIQRLAHAVQPLEFVAVAVAGKFANTRDRQRVVAGELREDPRPQASSLSAQCR